MTTTPTQSSPRNLARKTVTFAKLCKTLLVPTKEEYRIVGLDIDMWHNEVDLLSSRLHASLEISKLRQNAPVLSITDAMLYLYQPDIAVSCKNYAYWFSKRPLNILVVDAETFRADQTVEVLTQSMTHWQWTSLFASSCDEALQMITFGTHSLDLILINESAGDQLDIIALMSSIRAAYGLSVFVGCILEDRYKDENLRRELFTAGCDFISGEQPDELAGLLPIILRARIGVFKDLVLSSPNNITITDESSIRCSVSEETTTSSTSDISPEQEQDGLCRSSSDISLFSADDLEFEYEYEYNASPMMSSPQSAIVISDSHTARCNRSYKCENVNNVEQQEEQQEEQPVKCPYPSRFPCPSMHHRFEDLMRIAKDALEDTDTGRHIETDINTLMALDSTDDSDGRGSYEYNYDYEGSPVRLTALDDLEELAKEVLTAPYSPVYSERKKREEKVVEEVKEVKEKQVEVRNHDCNFVDGDYSAFIGDDFETPESVKVSESECCGDLGNDTETVTETEADESIMYLNKENRGEEETVPGVKLSIVTSNFCDHFGGIRKQTWEKDEGEEGEGDVSQNTPPMCNGVTWRDVDGEVPIWREDVVWITSQLNDETTEEGTESETETETEEGGIEEVFAITTATKAMLQDLFRFPFWTHHESPEQIK